MVNVIRRAVSVVVVIVVGLVWLYLPSFAFSHVAPRRAAPRHAAPRRAAPARATAAPHRPAAWSAHERALLAAGMLSTRR